MTISIDGTNGISGVDGSAATPALQGTDTNTGISFGADEVNIVTGGSTRATVDSSGNVGINTTSPSEVLDVNGAVKAGGNTSGVALLLPNANCAIRDAGASGSSLYFDVATGGATHGAFVFRSSNAYTERMRITSAGDITGLLGPYNNTIATGTNLHITSAGTLKRVTSSAKYKTSIETLEDSYADNILNCRPVWYRALGDEENPEYSWYGFIAEEVAEIDPRLVQYREVEVTYDEDGSPVTTPLAEPVPEGVSYERFVPHLLNLIKRQKEAIEALETRVAQLEGGAS